jgi:hypothetical protein
MKQTAVQWLLQKLFETNNNTNDAKKMDINKIIEQAKEMEKQQIIDSISNANKSNNRNVSLNPEQYYNETFKNE